MFFWHHNSWICFVLVIMRENKLYYIKNTCKIKALRAWCCKFSNLRNLLVTARKIFKSNEWDIYVFYVVEQNMKISQACDNHRFVFPFI